MPAVRAILRSREGRSGTRSDGFGPASDGAFPARPSVNSASGTLSGSTVLIGVSLFFQTDLGLSASLPRHALSRQFLGRLDLPPAFSAEGFQECDEFFLFTSRQPQRLHAPTEMRILIAALVVVLDHILERFQATVVHVGRGVLDLAK